MEGRIAFLPGDGIGPEVLVQARRVLEAIGEAYGHRFEIIEGAMGSGAIDTFGDPLPDATRELAVKVDAVLLGAVGLPAPATDPNRPDAAKGLLDLRKLLGNYANIRPVAVSDAIVDRSPFRAEHIRGVDLVVVRELLGGIYFGLPRGIEHGIAHNTEVYTEEEVRRIAKMAFEIARQRRKKVVSIDKSNVLESSVLWRRVATDVAKEYDDIEFSNMLVDNCAMQLIANPRQFDVILTNNMFGDILSDEASVLAGSLGMLPSASIGADIGLYEPVHGTAPDIAGKGIANPTGAILSVAMMLELSFKLSEEAAAIREGVSRALEEGYRTADLAADGEKSVSTSEMSEFVVGSLAVSKASGN